MNFKTWLINEFSEKTILYHRSTEKFEPGQIIEPYIKHKEDHWLKSQFTEKMLENFREKYAPDKPSRFNCVFCSVVPRSVFLTKGILYEVKPIGKIHTALAYYVNEINNVYNNEVPSAIIDKVVGFKDKFKVDKFKWDYNKERLLELFNKYWNTSIDITTWEDDGPDRPLKPFNSKEYEGDNQTNFRKDPKWIEVLCEKVQIIKVVEEKEKKDIFRSGDRVEFIKDIKVEHYGYDSFGNIKLSASEIEKIINHFEGEKTKYGTILKIKKGTTGIINTAIYEQIRPKKFVSRGPYDYTYRKSIYRSLSITPDGFNFSITLRPDEHEFLNQIIKKINNNFDI